MAEDTQEDNKNNAQTEQTLMDHLFELRDRLLHMVLAILIVFLGLFSFSEQIFTLAAGPLLALLPKGTSMIATGVTSPFLVPFKLVLLLSVLFTIPYLLHQLWSFIAPGLYNHEKRLVTPLLISSVILCYCGIAFAYFVIFPILFGFFIGITPQGVAVMTDIGQYLDFIIAIFFAFGLAFEVPVATFILLATGITTADKLAQKRPYIIIAAFVFGMLLTPPDVISQSLLAIPIWLLFELGLLMARIFIKDDEKENVIMENDEMALVEELPQDAQEDNPENDYDNFYNDDDHDAEGNYIGNDDADNEEPLSDEEMDKLLDEAEQEADANNAQGKSKKSADKKSKKNKKKKSKRHLSDNKDKKS